MRIQKLKINESKPRFYLRSGIIIDKYAIGDPPVCRPEKEYAKDLLTALNDKYIEPLPNKKLITEVNGERKVEEDVLIYKIKGATIALHTMVVALYNYKKQKYWDDKTAELAQTRIDRQAMELNRLYKNLKEMRGH